MSKRGWMAVAIYVVAYVAFAAITHAIWDISGWAFLFAYTAGGVVWTLVHEFFPFSERATR